MISCRPLGLSIAILGFAPSAALAQSAEGSVATGTIICSILGVLLAAACGAAFALWRLRERAREEARMLTDAFASESSPVLVTRRDGTILAANRAWRDVNGYDRVDPLHVVKRRLVEPADADRLAKAAAAGDTAEAELSNPVDDTRPQRLRTAPIGASSSYVLWRVDDAAPTVVADDASDADQRLDVEFDRLIAFAGGQEVGAYVVDGDGRLLHANERLAGWVGVENGGFTSDGPRLHDVLRPPNGAARLPYFPVPGDGDAVEGEATLISADGSELAVKVSSAVVATSNGAGLTARGVVVPLSAVEEATPAPAADRPLDQIFDCAPYGIALLDLLGRVVDANPAFATRAGWRRRRNDRCLPQGPDHR